MFVIFGRIDTWVNKRDIVVASDNVAEGGKSFFDALDSNRVRKRVANVL
jgi:hypothetical protein